MVGSVFRGRDQSNFALHSFFGIYNPEQRPSAQTAELKKRNRRRPPPRNLEPPCSASSANDLLNELDEMSFYIPETNETVTAVNRPITIITSVLIILNAATRIINARIKNIASFSRLIAENRLLFISAQS
jgi:hypothetical protein